MLLAEEKNSHNSDLILRMQVKVEKKTYLKIEIDQLCNEVLV